MWKKAFSNIVDYEVRRVQRTTHFFASLSIQDDLKLFYASKYCTKQSYMCKIDGVMLTRKRCILAHCADPQVSDVAKPIMLLSTINTG